MVEFVDASILDLAKSTEFLHHIRPSFRDKLVYGIKKPADTDRSVVFYLMPRNSEEKRTEADVETFICHQNTFWNIHFGTKENQHD